MFEIVKKFIVLGVLLVVESGVGDIVLIVDVVYVDVGVSVGDCVVMLVGVDIVFGV